MARFIFYTCAPHSQYYFPHCIGTCQESGTACIYSAALACFVCQCVTCVCLCVVSTVYYFLLKSNYLNYIVYPVFSASRTLLRPMLGLFQFLCFYLLNLHYFLCWTIPWDPPSKPLVPLYTAFAFFKCSFYQPSFQILYHLKFTPWHVSKWFSRKCLKNTLICLLTSVCSPWLFMVFCVTVLSCSFLRSLLWQLTEVMLCFLPSRKGFCPLVQPVMWTAVAT